MRVVEIMREELCRLHLQVKLDVATRRQLTEQGKLALKRGENPRATISKILSSQLKVGK